MDVKHYPRDVKRAKEQEFLHLEQRKMSVIEYVTKFNKLSKFAPVQVVTEEISIDHFKQGPGKY